MMNFQKECLFLTGMAVLMINGAFVHGMDLSGAVLNCCQEPVAGALVEYPSSGLSCRTDAAGKFNLPDASIRKNIIRNHSMRYDKCELYDLCGRRIIRIDKTGTIDPRLFAKNTPASCLIAQLTGAQGRTRITTIAVSGGRLFDIFENNGVLTKLEKRESAPDSLRISCVGFAPRSVPLSGTSGAIETIYLTRTIDASSDCGTLKARSDSAIVFGTKALKDSLRLSGAGCEWSAGGLSIAPPGSKFYSLLDAQPCGLFSLCAVTGAAGSYSRKVSSYAGYTGMKLLEPVLTKNGHISGLMLSEGATIDSLSYVVLSGWVMNPNRDIRRDIAQRQEFRPSLPVDSTILLSHFYIMGMDYSGCFKDSSAGRQDTVPVNAQSKFDGAKRILINSPAKVSGVLSNISIISNGTLSVQPDAGISFCRIMADKILIEGGTTEGCVFYATGMIKIKAGEHNSQFFSCDSIVVGTAVHSGPTSLWVSKKTEQNRACIVFERNPSLCGTAINLKGADWIPYSTSIHLDSGSVFSGYLVTDADISMKFVDITGSVYANAIVTSHNNMSYTNYLVGVSLHAPKSPLLFPLLGRDSATVDLIQSGGIVACY